jgi:hypothetical protein
MLEPDMPIYLYRFEAIGRIGYFGLAVQNLENAGGRLLSFSNLFERWGELAQIEASHQNCKENCDDIASGV